MDISDERQRMFPREANISPLEPKHALGYGGAASILSVELSAVILDDQKEVFIALRVGGGPVTQPLPIAHPHAISSPTHMASGSPTYAINTACMHARRDGRPLAVMLPLMSPFTIMKPVPNLSATKDSIQL
jgi:hypothetical protein